MNRRNIALGLVLTVGGLGVAAHNLLSFQVDAAGAKGMARAWIASTGTEIGIDSEVQGKVSGLAELGIDQAAPVLSAIYQNLSAIEGAGSDAKAAQARVDDLGRELAALVDVKDRVVAEAGKSLQPHERAGIIAKMGKHFHDQFHPTPEAVEGILQSLRAAHESAVKQELKLDDARAKALFSAMDVYAKQHHEVRDARRALYEKLSGAVTANASDTTLAPLLADWDKLTARQSDITRAQIAEAGKQFTLAEKVQLLTHAKQRLDRVMRVVALIARFAPVKG